MTEQQAWELYCKAVVDPRGEDFKTWCENSGIIIKEDKPMKTIDQYTIYCTEEHTKKALELGAPIEIEVRCCPRTHSIILSDARMGYKIALLPTAEQMIGWLESQKSIREVCIDLGVRDKWYYSLYNPDNIDVGGDEIFDTRKSATLAAIDAALGYLIKNK